MSKTLIIGAGGQLGSELCEILAAQKGAESILATDIRSLDRPYPTAQLNVLDGQTLESTIKAESISEVYHLAAVLSAKGEEAPLEAWDINMKGLLNVLEAARKFDLKVFWPSSIAVFGPDTPKENTPQYTVLNPTTVYGISKLAGERWCHYYFLKYGVDVRSLRYPGLIGYKAKPGGGTTDYAVDIFWKAINNETYECFLQEDAKLPMMYMADAISATLQIMNAPREDIQIRSSYNVAAMSFTPDEIYSGIRRHLPSLQITYKPDFRQNIADSWPDSIDDQLARQHWGWQHQYDLGKMIEDILENIKEVAQV